MTTIGTINEEGLNVDLYIPRKCHATNSIITAFDHAAIQITICDVDKNGLMVKGGKGTTFCISGFLRTQAESDHVINRLAIKNGIIRCLSGKNYQLSKKPAAVAKTGKKPQQARGSQANRAAPGKVPQRTATKNTASPRFSKGTAPQGRQANVASGPRRVMVRA